MVKTAGNTLKWAEHPLTVAGKGGYAIREGNTYNLIGGELPVGQSFAIFLNLAQTPASITDDTFGYTRRVFDYSIAPLNRILNHEKFTRVTGSGLQDLTLGGTYVGTTQKIYRVKVLEDSTDPETIAYKVSTDGGTTFSGSWLVPSGGANMSTSFSAIADGITIKFKAVTGHTETDEWEFYTGMPPSVEETKQTTGSGNDDLILTVQSAQNIVATHRDIFAIKIMTAASPDTYQYSTDGGVTYNGSNISCATGATELGSTNVMVAFEAITGHTAGNIWKFHVFPTTTFARYAPRGDRLLVGWVENIGEAKTKQVLMSAAALGETQNLNIPAGLSLDSSGITLSSQANTTTGERIKLTDTSIAGYTEDSTSDITHKWFEFNKDGYEDHPNRTDPALFMGEPTGTAGIPPGMEPGLVIENGNIYLEARPVQTTSGHFSNRLHFDAHSDYGENSRIFQYDGKVTTAINFDYAYGYQGLWIGGHIPSYDSVAVGGNDIILRHNVYPFQNNGVVLSKTSTSSSSGTTLKDSTDPFTANMVGRQFTRTTDGAVGTIATYVDTDEVTTTSIASGWASGQTYKLLSYANVAFTNEFGSIANGVASSMRGAEYSTNAAHKSQIHRLFHNIAAHVFEGQALRLWAKESDGWSNIIHPNPALLGHCIELGLAYNASGGYSYKINFPNDDTAPSAGETLKINSITTSGTNINGTKDQPYRIQLEWGSGGRSEVDIMTDGFIYG